MTRRKRKTYWPVAWMSGWVMGSLVMYWAPKAVDRFMYAAGPPPVGVSTDTYSVDQATAPLVDIDRELAELHRKNQGKRQDVRESFVVRSSTIPWFSSADPETFEKLQALHQKDLRDSLKTIGELQREYLDLDQRINRAINLLDEGSGAAAVEKVLRGEE